MLEVDKIYFEVFDPDTDKWTVLPPLHYHQFYGHFCDYLRTLFFLRYLQQSMGQDRALYIMCSIYAIDELHTCIQTSYLFLLF